MPLASPRRQIAPPSCVHPSTHVHRRDPAAPMLEFRHAIVDVPDATLLHLHEHHLLPLVPTPPPAVPLTEHPRRHLLEGHNTRSAAAVQSKEISDLHPSMGSGWRGGTSTTPARRRAVTLVVPTVEMSEPSRVFSSLKPCLPAPANVPPWYNNKCRESKIDNK